MAQLQVIVNKLNKRRSPVLDFSDKSNIVEVVDKGTTFESVNEIANSLGKWYVDRDGYYYWGKGVNNVPTSTNPLLFSNESTPMQFDSNKMSWGHEFYNIPFIWNDLKTRGKDITVAIIDTGIDKSHLDLMDNIHPLSRSYIGKESDFFDKDGHGTEMAGIIAAIGNSKVYGIAPDAKILVMKATPQIRGADPKTFAQALNDAAKIKEIDIISVSNGFFINDLDLQNAIQACLSAKKIIIAAIGNGRDFIGKPNGPDEDTFPACYDNVISVGAFDHQGELCTFSNWSSHLSLLAPGDFSVLTTGINNASVMGAGTSIATAFTAGSLALLLSYAKKNSISVEKCVQAILETCDDIGASIGKDIQSGNGRMNLRNAITRLK